MKKLFGVLLIIGYFGGTFGLCLFFGTLLAFPYPLLTNIPLGAFAGYNARRFCNFVIDNYFQQ